MLAQRTIVSHELQKSWRIEDEAQNFAHGRVFGEGLGSVLAEGVKALSVPLKVLLGLHRH